MSDYGMGGWKDFTWVWDKWDSHFEPLPCEINLGDSRFITSHVERKYRPRDSSSDRENHQKSKEEEKIRQPAVIQNKEKSNWRKDPTYIPGDTFGSHQRLELFLAPWTAERRSCPPGRKWK